jgi:zinc finger protein
MTGKKMREQKIKNYVLEDAVCPVCKNKGVVVTETKYFMPNFGKTLLTSMVCEKCGFKRSDVTSLEANDPQTYKIKITKPEDLLIRIMRSSTATIKIPELGITISPSSRAEGFISNVEGVLDRIINKTNIISNQSKNEKFFKKIKAAKRGSLPFTIIMIDPVGNSAIISDKIEKSS